MRLAHGGGHVFNSWFALTFQAAQLGWEAQNVVALRFVRLAGGGAAGAKEAQLMVTDKLAALTEAQLAAVAKRLLIRCYGFSGRECEQTNGGSQGGGVCPRELEKKR
jgi:hypothetical protein